MFSEGKQVEGNSHFPLRCKALVSPYLSKQDTILYRNFRKFQIILGTKRIRIN